MNDIVTAEALLTPAGIAVVTAAIVAILIKPYLTNVFPADEAGQRDPRYAIYMNLITFCIAQVLAVAATFVLELTAAQSWLNAFLIGTAGAVIATGVYEGAANARRYFARQ